MKRLVTAEEIRNMYFSNARELYLPEGAIITPGARDLIYAFNIKVIYGEPPGAGCGCAPSSKDQASSEIVTKVVESVMSGRSEEDKKRVVAAVLEKLNGGESR
ncbi:MAG TPA: hypothetical protein GXX40_07800 [Firmicutes bacterium]|nr:hypothetical protein [Bacillota bacterium]